MSMNHERAKKELVLAPLKLTLFNGFGPVRPVVKGIPCGRCNREDVALQSNASIGRARLVCEPCAVDEFCEMEGYESREVAASARRRSVETPLLFAELALFVHVREKRLRSVDDLPVADRARLVAEAHLTYITALSSGERREIETLREQAAIERRLRELLIFLDREGQGAALPKVDLSLTRNEYERLLVLSYLGNFMINGIFKERSETYDEVISKLFAKARESGFGRYVETAEGVSVPSKEFSGHADVKRYRREYDEEIFWDELVRRLADRDMRIEKGAAAIARLSQKQYEELISFYEIPYVEEFDRHGMKRIIIEESLNDETGNQDREE